MEARYVTVSPGGTMPKKGNMRWDAFPEFSIAHDGKAYTVGFDSGHTESFLDNSWLKVRGAEPNLHLKANLRLFLACRHCNICILLLPPHQKFLAI